MVHSHLVPQTRHRSSLLLELRDVHRTSLNLRLVKPQCTGYGVRGRELYVGVDIALVRLARSDEPNLSD